VNAKAGLTEERLISMGIWIIIGLIKNDTKKPSKRKRGSQGKPRGSAGLQHGGSREAVKAQSESQTEDFPTGWTAAGFFPWEVDRQWTFPTRHDARNSGYTTKDGLQPIPSPKSWDVSKEESSSYGGFIQPSANERRTYGTRNSHGRSRSRSAKILTDTKSKENHSLNEEVWLLAGKNKLLSAQNQLLSQRWRLLDPSSQVPESESLALYRRQET